MDFSKALTDWHCNSLDLPQSSRARSAIFNIGHQMTIRRGSRAQATANNQLLSALEAAMRIYAPAREMCRYSSESFNETTYQPNVAAKV